VQGGTWSAPLFISVFAGGIGFTLGYSEIDSLIVLDTAEAVQRYAANQTDVATDLAAVGPLGKGVAALGLCLDAAAAACIRNLLRLWYGLWLAGRVGIDSPPLCLLRPCMPAVAGQDSVSLLTLSEETFPYSVASGTLVDLSYKGERQLGLHTLLILLVSQFQREPTCWSGGRVISAAKQAGCVAAC
jgi:sodium-coupled neutral amino acid transporter 10